MNVETTLEQELQAELSRLKRAVDYIEQAEKTVQEVQQINKENQRKFEKVLQSNESLRSEISKQASVTDKKFEQLVAEMSKLTATINAQQKEIRHNKNGVDILGAHVQQVQQVNKDNETRYEEALKLNEALRSEMTKQTSAAGEKFGEIVDELGKLANIINAQQKEIEDKQKGVEMLGVHLKQVQQVNKDNETRYEEALKLNEALRSEMTKQTSAADKKFEGLVDEMNKLAKQVDELQNKNEQQASLKWYQRLFR